MPVSALSVTCRDVTSPAVKVAATDHLFLELLSMQGAQLYYSTRLNLYTSFDLMLTWLASSAQEWCFY